MKNGDKFKIYFDVCHHVFRQIGSSAIEEVDEEQAQSAVKSFVALP